MVLPVAALARWEKDKARRLRARTNFFADQYDWKSSLPLLAQDMGGGPGAKRGCECLACVHCWHISLTPAWNTAVRSLPLDDPSCGGPKGDFMWDTVGFPTRGNAAEPEDVEPETTPLTQRH